jgi:hydroxymethylbilane synthase
MSSSRRLWPTLRIGTRSSPLARWQAEWVADQLRHCHPGLEVVLVEIKTEGDRDRNTPLAQLGGTGVFTKEIQRAVLSRDVEVAVHSLKDLPTAGHAELALAAIPPREDVSDALVAPTHGTLDALPPGARVGTGSIRRRAQLLHLRHDLQIVPIRGNVETRLRQTLEGVLDAVVLAWAGLRRLGLQHLATQRLAPPTFLPAVGQGALAVECHRDDFATLQLLACLDDPVSRRAVVAERQALAELEGGCLIPLAAWARDVTRPATSEISTSTPSDGPAAQPEEGLALDAALYDPDGQVRLFASLQAPREAPERLGRRVAAALRDQGAEQLLARLRPP